MMRESNRRRRRGFSVYLRQIVSAVPKRRWFNEAGFNIDLTRFPDKRFVVMAWPSDSISFKDPKRSKLVRNDAEEVKHCLREFFPKGFKIYNLCCESQSFRGQDLDVAQYGWLDHEPPPFGLFVRLLADIDEYLEQNPENGVAIHCKAGKGRTGTTAAAYLLKDLNSADRALAEFGSRRFGREDDGVTIPSQKRYVKYYEKFTTSGEKYQPATNTIRGLRVTLAANLTNDCKEKLSKSLFKISGRKYSTEEREKLKSLDIVLKSEVKGIAIDERTVELPLNDVELSGDFKLTVVQKESTAVFKSERTICSFWNEFLLMKYVVFSPVEAENTGLNCLNDS
ncbi:Oidioi.mRNA.OKI2018_I69.PAR.g9057.t1.cds [Oikopleura dioica]|uniref:Oidioi.mRNA.OKI2018_I69.PAR.g9057.t1.cds n=1 Tax=Oikopleura dioica TaxID=34765 RepID=A0ABN7RME9_OIKDI|nr:Oidioi.mRNA.OKI2018_I69.PAR.g9057.t1.cds [Oikopleura dioica]